jgi:hypothetical protein
MGDSSSAADRDEALSTFIAVTGCTYEVAREALETSKWQLERAINTHLEVNALQQQNNNNNNDNSMAEAGPPARALDVDAPSSANANTRPQQQSSVAAGLQGGNVIDLADDLMDEISLRRRGSSNNPTQQQPQTTTATAARETPSPRHVPHVQGHALQSRNSANEIIDVDLEDATNERSNHAQIVVDNADRDRNYIEEQMLKQALEESLQTVNQRQSEVAEEDITQNNPGMGPSSSMVQDESAANHHLRNTQATATTMGQYLSADDQPMTSTGLAEVKNEADTNANANSSRFMTGDSPHASSHNLQRSNSYSSNLSQDNNKNMVDSTMMDVQDATGSIARDQAPRGTVTGTTAVVDVDEDPIVLPEGVNAEEAKMLEAAMFGIPYQGPVPQANNTNHAAFRDTISSSSITPEMRAQRRIRMEQDRDFYASLKLDQEKEATKQRQEMEKRRKIQEENDRKKLESQRLEDMKERLEAELSIEPSEPVEEIVSVMIRLPDGTRLSRKFLKANKVTLLFHFVDYVICTQKEGSDLNPGTYKLLTQFPRKVIVDTDTNTLEDVGLVNKQEALFVEKIL